MPGKYGFDFNGASQSFNTLAEYLFGKVVKGTYRESNLDRLQPHCNGVLLWLCSLS